MADDNTPNASQTSLGIAGARTLATVTKTPPQMRGISSRWLLRLLPWVQTAGGVYRVNRRLVVRIDDGRVSFTGSADTLELVPVGLRAIPMLRNYDNEDVLALIAAAFTKQEFNPGADLAQAGETAENIVIIGHGKVELIEAGEYGEPIATDLLGGGDYFGQDLDANDVYPYTAKAATAVTAFVLTQSDWANLINAHQSLADHLAAYQASLDAPQNADGEALIRISSDHELETALTPTFVDYDLGPREYELSVAQAVLRISTRVADLYNEPHNQTEHQLRLTIEALRERQEDQLINNPEFGLVHNTDVSQRIFTQSGPPTPDDFDNLLALVWKEPDFFLAHPKTISAFARECSRRGIYPASVDYCGHQVPAWRGVPIFPCNKLEVDPKTKTSSVLLMRTGEQNRGVVGLHQVGIPDEVEPSLSVRFMGIDEKAVISYLVSAYYSAAVLVPDAIAMLEHAQLGSIPPE